MVKPAVSNSLSSVCSCAFLSHFRLPYQKLPLGFLVICPVDFAYSFSQTKIQSNQHTNLEGKHNLFCRGKNKPVTGYILR